MSKKIYGIPVSTPLNPAKVVPYVPAEKIASSVAEYMEANPITPGDIGARPDDWLPTPAEIGAVSKQYVDARTIVATDPNNDGHVVLKYGGVVEGGGTGGGTVPGGSSGGLTAEQVQDMINDALSKLPTAEELPSAEEVSF